MASAGARGPHYGLMRAALPLLLVAVVLPRIPFLNQAIQGDDVNYLAAAQYAQVDPLHPNHARYVFQGDMVDMRGHPHPPLNAWFLAALLALWRDVYEVPFHAAYILFSLLAAASMWALARRFTARPVWATLLFLAAPAFVVNGGSLESDLPFLAFWMAAAACFVRAADARSPRWLAAACAAQALAALAAFQSVVLVPILGLYLWDKRRDWRAGWLALLVTPAVLGAYQLLERAASGELPAAVLAGYFQSYGLQRIENKLRNAAALTAHLAWVVGPLLAAAAFHRVGVWLALPAAAAAGAFWLDANPLFWGSFALGVLFLVWCARAWRDWLAAWALLFFAAALALFFAGSARYLLPMTAPVALLAVREMGARTRWLAAGLALQLALSLGLATANYDHWDGYRRFTASLRKEFQERRVWINGEWGLRFYAESEGGLPVERGQAVRPGDVVVSSALALPIPYTTGGGTLAPLAEREIRARVPLRLIALDSRSAWSSAANGLRPFDVSSGAIDRVRADVVVERKPTLSWLPMNAPEAQEHIVSGLDQVEDGRFRWMGQRAVLLLRRPAVPSPAVVELYLPPQAAAREVSVTVDGRGVLRQALPGPGPHTLRSQPVAPERESVIMAIEADRTFSVPGDRRKLGMILVAAGFGPPERR